MAAQLVINTPVFSRRVGVSAPGTATSAKVQTEGRGARSTAPRRGALARSVRALGMGLATALAPLAGFMAHATPAWAASFDSNAASAFISDINALRASHGLAALAANSQLASVAAAWSQHMAAAGGISHNPDLANQLPPNWQKAGENVGEGPDEPSLQQAFTNSPHHYANMVDPAYNQIGVAVLVTDSGTMFVTEDFMEAGSPQPAPAPAPAPSQPARSAATASAAAPPAAAPVPRPAPAQSAAAPRASVPTPTQLPPAPVATVPSTVPPTRPASAGPSSPGGRSSGARSHAGTRPHKVRSSHRHSSAAHSATDHSVLASAVRPGPAGALAALAVFPGAALSVLRRRRRH